ncbi:hypothetical protein FRC12_010723 [Ceratobasidium sp. 428]|nr:hypothetical protein FRC12_010723 [Ceratobasidium sp. 428]
MATSLPTEVLLAICEYTRTQPKSRIFGSNDSGCLEIKAFSCASKRFREVAVPLLFRKVCMRTREQVVALVKSPLLENVSHVHFPAINILTCRRPLGTHIYTLIAQATSIKLASTEPAFYTDISRHLGPLLSSCSTRHLTGVELYYGDGVNLPHVDPTAAMAEFVGLLGGSGSGVKALSVRLPGGRPSFAGIEALFNRISSSSNPLSNLHQIFLSLQLPLQLALSPSDLALSLARRLPKLQLVAIATPKRGGSTDMSIWGMGGPGGHPPGWGMSGGELKIWEVSRKQVGEHTEGEEVVSVVEAGEKGR